MLNSSVSLRKSLRKGSFVFVECLERKGAEGAGTLVLCFLSEPQSSGVEGSDVCFELADFLLQAVQEILLQGDRFAQVCELLLQLSTMLLILLLQPVLCLHAAHVCLQALTVLLLMEMVHALQA